MKKIVVVNASPRLNYNTNTLLNNAEKGVKEEGGIVQKFDLYKLEKFTGCISCFSCKTNKNKGHCVVKDGLTEVLDAIRESDGLIIGSPNYLSEMTAGFRALYERLIFQNFTYNVENFCCNENHIPVLFIMTSNAIETTYVKLVEEYKNMFEKFIGPTKTFISGNTLQLNDYSHLDWEWTKFNIEEKIKRHKEIFPKECEEVYNLGKEMVK